MSDASCDWPWAVCFELPAIYSLWLPQLGLGTCGRTKLHAKTVFYQHRAHELVSKSSKAPRDPPLPASSCGLPLGSITERASDCTPQQGISSPGLGKRGSPEGGAVTFPQADVAMREELHPRKMGFAASENDSAQISCQLSLQLPLRATNPRFSSDVSSLLHPPSAIAQDEWL